MEESMIYAAYILIGLIAGALFMFLYYRLMKRDMEKSFTALSHQALASNQEMFLRQANESLTKQSQLNTGDLEAKKQVIDRTLESIRTDLEKVEKSIADADVKREGSFREISGQLKGAAEQTQLLQTTTNKLQMALGSSKARGYWGERMAEDILRHAGFIEGVNYLKQKSQEMVSSRPDYIFLLPFDKKINMDVKFPWENYKKCLDCENEVEMQSYRQQFLKDVRNRIKEVTTRDYINPAENTLDYVIIFIPVEQVYSFINESDGTIIDDALKNKVILCSPLTLYAILAVIRQAMDNFAFSKTNSEIRAQMEEFDKQWEEFKKCMDRMGGKLDDASEEYRRLTTVRGEKLEKPLRKIEELRSGQG
jgi:DNA recombination protein RmuC